jgi:hypothetical protein
MEVPMISTDELKTAIQQGQFQSLNYFIVKYLTDKFFPRQRGGPINKLTFSVLLGVIFALLVLIGLAVNKLSGAAQVNQQVMSIFILGIVYIYILCIVIEFQIGNFLKTTRDNLLDALVKDDDRQHLRASMTTFFSTRSQFSFGIIFSLLTHIAFIALDPSLVFSFGLGLMVVNLVFHAFHGFCVYFYLAYLSWSVSNLKDYEFDLFELDPCSTMIIAKLATMLQSIISVMTLMVASATLIFSSTRVLPFASVGAMIILMWINTIGLYFINRHILRSIIIRAKSEKLYKIQTQIRQLDIKDQIPTKETLDHITQLKEYHDKIKDAPDSPWDFIRFMGTMNTLIWPTLGIVASNAGSFLDLITRLTKK